MKPLPKIRSRLHRGFLGAAVGLLVLGLGLGVAFQASLDHVLARHDDSGTIHACISRTSGAMRYVQDPTSCTRYEYLIEWKDGAAAQAELETQIAALDARLSTAEGEIDALQTDVGTLQTDVAGLQTDVSDLQTRVGTLESDVSTLQSNVSTLQADVANLQTRVGDLETDVAGLLTDVSDLQTRVGTLEADVTNLQTRVTTLETNVADLQTRVSAIEGDFVKVVAGVVNADGTKQTGNRFTSTSPVAGEYVITFDPGSFDREAIAVIMPFGSVDVSSMWVTTFGDGSATVEVTLSAASTFTFHVADVAPTSP